MLPEDIQRHTSTVSTRYGELTFLRDDDPIGRALREYGEWAESELTLLTGLIAPGDTVIDVGANIGTHTLSFSRAVGPSGRVIAFEPHPVLFQLLRHNLEQNRAANVRVENAAVGSSRGTVRIPTIDLQSHANFGSFTVEVLESSPDPGVPMVAVDEVDVGRPRLLKVDVEGWEPEVLRGAARTIREARPFILFEANSIASSWKAVEALTAPDYAFLFCRTRAFNPNNFRGNQTNSFGYAVETSVLCVPREQLAAIRPVLAAADVHPFTSVDELARLLVESPRYGDSTPDDRSPERLRARLADLTQERDKLQASLGLAEQSCEQVRAQKEWMADTQGERVLDDRLSEPAGSPPSSNGVKISRVANPLSHLLQRGAGLAERAGGPAKQLLEWTHQIRQRNAYRAIRDSGLFDERYYRETQAPALGQHEDPIRHYLRQGYKHGLDPSPLFQTRYYLDKHPDVAAAGINPFFHYVTLGGFEGRRPNPYFDSEFYLRQFPKLAEQRQHPLLHYLTHGEKVGARPAPGFDPRYYLRENRDVRQAGFGALEHYLRWGIREGRLPLEGKRRPPRRAPLPTAPTEDEWSLARPRTAADATIDVIVPVYAGADQTLRCIHRVLTAPSALAFELIVIDDCSPEPDLTARLQELAGRGLFTYLRNDTNLGFVQTVNRGMRLHSDRDIVLLNSDTEVFNDWLDRMHRLAEARPEAGTVTPLSNSATICSYPFLNKDNDMLLELPFEELDLLAKRVNAGRFVELPTAVGFCVYIRRACIAQVGLFDAERFGKGYGEENDFCRRAIEAGWKNYLAGDIFVRHVGGTSFGESKESRIESALKIIDRLHPDYLPEVARFSSEDRPGELRRRLDVARIRRAIGHRSVAMVVHAMGGGTEQHFQELRRLAASEDVGTLIIRPSGDSPTRVTVSVDSLDCVPNLAPFDTRWEAESLAYLLTELGVRHIHCHHLAGLDEDAPDWLARVAAAAGIHFDYTLHDYSAICPQITLIDGSGRYCGEPEVARCEDCVQRLGSPYGKVRVASWRGRYRALLRQARRVFVPSADVALRMKRYFPEIEMTVRGHLEPPVARRLNVKREPGERLRVAVIGAIGPHKGHHLLIACAADARARNLPLEFVVVGYTADDERAASAGIAITGAYQSNDDVFETLERVGAHVALFPALWPETYSYTLSVALNAGLFPISFDIGAIAERLKTLKTGLLLPIADMDRPAVVNDALVSLMKKPLPIVPAVPSHTPRLSDYYDGLFG